MIYICIPVHNRIEYTLKCIESIEKQNYKDYKIIICDDNSTDGTSKILAEKYPNVIVVKGDGNFWWTGGTNMCVKEALKTADENDFIFTLNNDTELLNDTLMKLIEFLKENHNCIVGAVNLFYNEPNKIEPSAFVHKQKKIFFKKLLYRLNAFGELLNNRQGIVEVETLSGKGVLIPVKVFKKIGLYNQEKLPHYHADCEFILRARRSGFRVFISYDAKILSHQELSGMGTATSKPSIRNFIKSFFNLKSANHLKSLFNYSKFKYGSNYLIYFIIDLLRIIGGFFRRYTRYLIGK